MTTPTFNTLAARFEAEVVEKAAELLLAGEHQPDQALSRARPLVLVQWKMRAAHRQLMGDKLTIVPDPN